MMVQREGIAEALERAIAILKASGLISARKALLPLGAVPGMADLS
jgi:hypothetical protein